MANSQKRPDYTGLIIGAGLAPAVPKENWWIVCTVLIATLLAIRVCWNLRKHIWFWALIVLMLALHVPLFFIDPWPHRWLPARGMLPIVLVDFLIIAGAVHLVEKFIVKLPPEEGGSTAPFIQIVSRKKE